MCVYTYIHITILIIVLIIVMMIIISEEESASPESLQSAYVFMCVFILENTKTILLSLSL